MDIRAIQAVLKANGIALDHEADTDGNVILIDQHV
jgi:hypothetical protein